MLVWLSTMPRIYGTELGSCKILSKVPLCSSLRPSEMGANVSEGGHSTTGTAETQQEKQACGGALGGPVVFLLSAAWWGGHLKTQSQCIGVPGRGATQT